MTGTDIVAIRQEQAEARSKGDLARANELYQAEMAALDGRDVAPAAEQAPAPSPPSLPAGVTAGSIMDSFREVQPELVEVLEEQWREDGTTPERELPYASWFIDNFVPQHMQDHPLPANALWWAAALGRHHYGQARDATAPTAQAPRKAPTMATDINETAAEDELRALRSQIQDAQARGDTRRANRLFAQEQQIIAARKGNQPIVNGSSRTA